MTTNRRHLAAAIGALALLTAGATAPAMANEPDPAPAPSRQLTAHPERVQPGKADPTVVSPTYDQKTLGIMAKSSGRTIDQQRQHLSQQAAQNNAYASLHQQGYDYDGAYFDGSNRLVLQADPASPAGHAAAAKGLKVRKVQFGEEKLNAIVADLNTVSSRQGVVSFAPSISADRVVVSTSGAIDPAFAAKAKEHGTAIVFTKGQKLSPQTTVYGGDKISMASGGYCSAGFPATTSDGGRVMIWAGHCVENQQTFYKGSTQIGTFAATAFKSYDGQPDRDIGAIWIDSDDTMSAVVNKYGTSGRITDGTRGPWKAPIGTDMCKSGATSGITCGKVTSYNNSVTYTDNQGRVVAAVSGLMQSTVCTAPGDSGGAFTSNGYAVGMTSGGPSNQTCAWNGGYLSGKSSYVQPITDALSYYGLTFG